MLSISKQITFMAKKHYKAMKKLLLALLLTTLSSTLFAQLKPYQPNPVLDKFVGTWIAQMDKKTVIITIKKIQVQRKKA